MLRHADTHKLVLVRCRGVRRMHLRSNAHGSLLHAKFQFCGQIESMHKLNFAHGIECLSEGECDDKEKEISR